MFSLALTSIKVHLHQSASIRPYYAPTLRYSLKSHLFPTINFGNLLAPFCYNCIIQFPTSSKERLSSTAYTMTIPEAPLKQVSVNVRKRSCPAVSHNCNLMRLLSFLLARATSMIFDLKSTPMVGVWDIEQFLSMKRSRMLVLPTAELPMMTILARQSQSPSFGLDNCRFNRYIFHCLTQIILIGQKGFELNTCKKSSGQQQILTK